MTNINAKTCAKSCIYTVNVIKKDNQSCLWIKMYDIEP